MSQFSTSCWSSPFNTQGTGSCPPPGSPLLWFGAGIEGCESGAVQVRSLSTSQSGVYHLPQQQGVQAAQSGGCRNPGEESEGGPRPSVGPGRHPESPVAWEPKENPFCGVLCSGGCSSSLGHPHCVSHLTSSFCGPESPTGHQHKGRGLRSQTLGADVTSSAEVESTLSVS